MAGTGTKPNFVPVQILLIVSCFRGMGFSNRFGHELFFPNFAQASLNGPPPPPAVHHRRRRIEVPGMDGLLHPLDQHADPAELVLVGLRTTRLWSYGMHRM